MQVEQISVFIENKSGRLAEVPVSSGKPGSTSAPCPWRTPRISVSCASSSMTGKSEGSPQREGLHRQQDRSRRGRGAGSSRRARAKSCRSLDQASINVEYMYAFVERCGENAVIIFRFDETEKAIKLLAEKGFNILQGERLYSI